MRYGLDKNNNKIEIDDAIDGNEYFCQICKEPLILKRGLIRAHHFSHCKNSKCTDNWNYEELSEWHANWQKRFPDECQEVVMIKDGVAHRADVFVDGVVIEFQHSPISKKEFDERNKFYTSLGHEVYWIFDLIDDYNNGSLREPDKGDYNFYWSRPRSNFLGFDVKSNKNISIFFQIDNNISEDNPSIPVLVKINAEYLGFKRLYSNYIDNSTKAFLRMIDYNCKDYLFDNMYEEHNIGSIDSDHIFVGCPKDDKPIIVTTSDCSKCKYYRDYYECHYAEKSLNISDEIQIKKITRDKHDLISKIIVVNGNNEEELVVNRKPMIGKTIKAIWNEKKPSNFIVVYNINNKTLFKISKDPNELDKKYGKVYGYFSTDLNNFNGESVSIYGFYNPIWLLVESK